ncbi:MAG TPA: ABC transporter ATP-binding protein [Anaerolineales bacterium]|nr:ABC transporter ATP-binding protein [Anaerolineales bacterium]
MNNTRFQSRASQERNYQGENPILTFAYLYSDQRGRLLLAILLYFIKASPVWAMPLLTAHVIDLVTTGGPKALENLWLTALILAVMLLQNIPMHYLYVRQISQAVRTVGAQLRSAIVHRLQQLSIDYYKSHSAGRLQNKVLRDVESIEVLTRTLYDGGLGAFFAMVIAIITTAIRAPAFLLVFLVTVPIAVAVLRGLRGALTERNAAFRLELERMSARVIEMTHLIPITRAHGLEENELERVDATLSEVKNAGLELDATTALFGAVSWVTFNLFNIGCLIFTAWAYFTRFIPITVGDIVLLTGYFNSLTNSVMLIINMIPDIAKGFESIRSIGEVLQSPDLEQNQGKQAVEAVKGEIVFEGVSFRYPDGEEDAVRDFSLSARPGETVALVGPSGSGKTTVLNLVIGFIRPTSGRLLLDGQDMENLDLRTYRRFLSVVSQDTILFDGSVQENVTYGLKTFREAAIEAALRDANALEFVEHLPDGLNTNLGEKGARLSGGQKQRLAIARALIRNPRLLILDEATSALDVESEALIQEALERLMRGRTTFVVAHRLSTIRNAGRIIVMEDGRIVEAGSHEELLGRNGSYARLYSHQAA